MEPYEILHQDLRLIRDCIRDDVKDLFYNFLHFKKVREKGSFLVYLFCRVVVVVCAQAVLPMINLNRRKI